MLVQTKHTQNKKKLGNFHYSNKYSQSRKNNNNLRKNYRRREHEQTAFQGKVVREFFSWPLWVKGFFLLQQTSSLFCFLTILSMFAVYGMTVYAPQLWTNQFKKLQDLQKNERQITFTNEVVKDQLAQQANKSNVGLVDPDPSNVPIFLQPTPTKTIQLNQGEKKEIKIPSSLMPLGY